LSLAQPRAELSFCPEPSQELSQKRQQMTLLGHSDSRTDAPTLPPRCHWLTTTAGTDMVDVVILLRWHSALPDERHRGRAPMDT
jgi:hypothetical protein